jgi:hypothetical protein
MEKTKQKTIVFTLMELNILVMKVFIIIHNKKNLFDIVNIIERKKNGLIKLIKLKYMSCVFL